MKIKAAILTIALAGFSLTAFAQTATPKVNKVQKAQKTRIIHGKATGTLNKTELKALRLQQAHIRRAEKRAKSDGVVTATERAVLQRKQRRANKAIRVHKHN